MFLSASVSLAAVFAADAQSLRDSIGEALKTNPEILQATENREAVEFELRQARGLYLPSIDLEGSVGVQSLDSPSRRRLAVEDDELYPAEVGLSLTQTLFDGGERRSEVERQAARVDGASFRIVERSEAIALEVVQNYLEYLLQLEIVEEARRNVGFHQQILGDIDESVQGGALTAADRLQGRERLAAAQARLKQATEELEEANIRFRTVVGRPLTTPKFPGSVARALPRSVEAAIDKAYRNNPRVFSAGADVDAADAMVRQAKSAYLPRVTLEGRARVGDDIDGNEGHTENLEAKVVARWNLYRGGRDVAKEQERIRRAGEQRMVLHQVHREVEESVRSAWNRRIRQAELAQTLNGQAATNAQLVNSYREQFRIGQRSLLDVLDAQNTRVNVGVLSQTAQYASLFAEYRLLAATGSLVKTMNLAPAEQAEAYARTEFGVESAADPDYIRLPSRQEVDLPLDLLAPVRQ